MEEHTGRIISKLRNALKFGRSEKAKKFEKISHFIWHLLSRRQIKWETASNFVAFLENLNFEGGVISAGIFDLVPFSKSMNQITVPQLKS